EPTLARLRPVVGQHFLPLPDKRPLWRTTTDQRSAPHLNRSAGVRPHVWSAKSLSVGSSFKVSAGRARGGSMVRVYSSRNVFAFCILPSSFFLRREFHLQPVDQCGGEMTI